MRLSSSVGDIYPSLVWINVGNSGLFSPILLSTLSPLCKYNYLEWNLEDCPLCALFIFQGRRPEARSPVAASWCSASMPRGSSWVPPNESDQTQGPSRAQGARRAYTGRVLSPTSWLFTNSQPSLAHLPKSSMYHSCPFTRKHVFEIGI